MDKVRQGEIAYALLKFRAYRSGIQLAGIKREMGNVSKETGIPTKELKEFSKRLIKELIGETFD